MRLLGETLKSKLPSVIIDIEIIDVYVILNCE